MKKINISFVVDWPNALAYLWGGCLQLNRPSTEATAPAQCTRMAEWNQYENQMRGENNPVGW